MCAVSFHASKARGGYRHLRTSSHGRDALGYSLPYQVATQLLDGRALPFERTKQGIGGMFLWLLGLLVEEINLPNIDIGSTTQRVMRIRRRKRFRG